MDRHRIVYVVDDDDELRFSLEDLILAKSEWRVRSFSNGERWLAHAGKADPGCLLLDLHLPDLGGLDILEHLRTSDLPHQTVVLTGEGNVSAAVTAMRAGAVDFLEKPIGWLALEKSLRMAFDRLEDAASQQRLNADALARIDRLTTREREVLEGMVEGLPNKLIAYRLGVSTRTVEVHRASLMDKMDLHSLADVLKCAFAAGLVEALNK